LKRLTSIVWICICSLSSFAFAEAENTLVGLDTNKNGIRDDIDEYIKRQNYTAEQLKAVNQYCRTLQQAVTLNSENRDRAKELSDKNGNAMNCLYTKFTTSPAPAAVVTQYEKLTANTNPRQDSYKKFSKALNGTILSLPDGDTCDK